MADNENTPPPTKPAREKPCAICGKPVVARYKPFCSSRCADIDLGRWLKGSYVIPGAPVDEAESGKPDTATDEEP
jgi:endogenous inhibitor of DNA gyrase (YacG/DUF329 family)